MVYGRNGVFEIFSSVKLGENFVWILRRKNYFFLYVTDLFFKDKLLLVFSESLESKTKCSHINDCSTLSKSFIFLKDRKDLNPN